MSDQKKILVAYFSCGGTTKAVAESLAKAAGADVFEIQPKVPYTSADLNWSNSSSRSTVEMNDPSSRPEIASRVEKMNEYDVVFVGFPIWWYVAPTIIHTFLESYDFAGKTIVPFCSSGGSGLDRAEKILHSLCPNSVTWLPGRRLDRRSTRDDLAKWVASLKL